MRPNDDVLTAWRLLLETHQRVTGRMDRELREQHGLRLSWYDVLLQLNEAGGRMRMHELADATLFSRTDCTRIVARMEGAGLVLRERAAEDGRGIYAVLTDGGRGIFRRAAPTHLDGIQRLFGAHVRTTEATVLAKALARTLRAAPE